LRPNLLHLPATRPGDPFGTLGHLLVSGSDSRLQVNDRTRLNGYGCQPFPRPLELSFSSSTASTVSQRAYAATESVFRHACGGIAGDRLEAACDELAERVRHDIETCFELNDAGVDIVLSPSGTDAQLPALYLARCVLEQAVTSVIVAADETGNGVGLAAAGRHFDLIASGGRAVDKGEPIAGLATDVPSVPIAVRDRDGHPLAPARVDEEVRTCVARTVAAGRCVVLHVMNHSKTGGHFPSLECVGDILAAFGRKVQIVVDACQTRLSRARLRRYLDLGCMVLITGSKFFTGPPLSGALIVPAALAARLRPIDWLPEGLADYTTRYDWPRRFDRVRSHLPRRTTIGPLLRWIAAVEEMRAYFAVPEFVRKLVLREFGAAVARTIERYPQLQPVPAAARLPAPNDNDDEFDVRTIYPLLVRRGDGPLSLAQARTLYRALNDDVSGSIGRDLTPAERALAARLCHIGQPVAIADGAGGAHGAIRISADARVVYECWSPADRTVAVERMQRRFAEIRIVLDKVALLAENLAAIDEAYAGR